MILFSKYVIFIFWLVSKSFQSEYLEKFYTKYSNYNILSTYKNQYLIQTSTKQYFLDCLSLCNQNDLCSLVTFNDKMCNLYLYIESLVYLVNTKYSLLYIKINNSISSPKLYVWNGGTIDGLINYWPFIENYNDIIGGSNMYGGENYYLTSDRIGKDNSALWLNDGYIQVPSGIYFSGDFSVLAWVKIHEHKALSRLIDFGELGGRDNVIIVLSTMPNYTTDAEIFYGTKGLALNSLGNLTIGVWNHLALTLRQNIASFYLDGQLIGQNNNVSINNVNRSNCYFGFHNWGQNTDFKKANAEIDEVKFYNKALSQSQIIDDFNFNDQILFELKDTNQV